MLKELFESVDESAEFGRIHTECGVLLGECKNHSLLGNHHYLHLKSDLRRVITHLGLGCFYYLSQEPLGILGPGNEITVINLVISQFILGEIALYSFVIYSLYLHISTSFPPGTIRMNLL